MDLTNPLYRHYRFQLSQSLLFCGLSKDELDSMLKKIKFETWSKNTQSTTEQIHTRFYIIIEGRIKVVKINPNTGKSIALGILGKGEAFDMISLLDGEKHHPIAIALDDLQLLSAPMQSVHDWLEKYPTFNHNLMPYLAKQMLMQEALITDLALYDTSTRLARLILHYIECNEEEFQHQFARVPLFHNLTNETLAQLLGSVRQVVNKHLQTLKVEGVVKVQDHNWTVEKLDALKEKAGILANYYQ